MKKIILTMAFVMALVSSAYAEKFTGVIRAIDGKNHKISVSGFYVLILPSTSIMLKNAGVFGANLDGRFKDLRVGDMVEGTTIDAGNGVAAKTLIVERTPNSAY